ncbi:MAG TPA: RICIN domain-containing protein, partial [Streptomyces sp.]
SGAGRGAFGAPGRVDEGGSGGDAGAFGASGRRGGGVFEGYGRPGVEDAGFGGVGRPVAGSAWGEGSSAGESGWTGGDSAGAFAGGGFPDPDALPLDASSGEPSSGGLNPEDDRPRSRRAAGRAKVLGSRGARGARRAVRRVGKGRSPRALIAGVGVASAGVLTTFLASGMWTDGGSDPAASTVSGGALPGTDSPAPTSSPGAQGGTDLPGGTHQTRLRNADADLCVELPAGARAGTALVLEVCSSNWSQQWAYEDDGLLRNVAEPKLCVDSRADAGVVIANVCADAGSGRADDVRYDLTVQGELLPRWNDRLPLAAVGKEPGANVAVKVRDGSAAQRWLTDAPRATPRDGADSASP